MIVFSYVAVFVARARAGNYAAIEGIPYNLWVVMGFSTATMITAKAVATSYAAKGKVSKKARIVDTNTDTKGKKGNMGARVNDLVKDDSDFPDLSKAQLLTWTLVAVGIYIASVVHEIGNGTSAIIPDISTTLMVLMGLSQGAYIGKKLTTTTTPRITGLAPGAGSTGTNVKIIGLQFGSEQNGSMVAIDGNPIAVDIPSADWKDTEITFTLPQINLAGITEKCVKISVIVNAQESNKVPFTVTAQAR